MKKWLAVTIGILTAIGGFVDIGDLVTNALVGARFGMSLTWIVVVGVIGICVFAEMSGRIAAIAGRPTFDLVRERLGARPSVDTVSPDVRIYAHLTETDCTLYLDTTGEPLFKRGWRMEKGEAPLKENLAAGILRLAGWVPGQTEQPFYDPMCGSGTFLVEATQVALGLAPGAGRSFAFEWLKGADTRGWQALKAAAQADADAARKRAAADPLLIQLRSDQTRFDGTPHLLIRPRADGVALPLGIPGIQVDRATETLAQLEKHLRHALEFVDDHHHERHWGFDNCIIPFLFTKEIRKKRAMQFVHKERGACPFLLFKTICLQTMEGTRANRGLLSYRQVLLMDVFVARPLRVAPCRRSCSPSC